MEASKMIIAKNFKVWNKDVKDLTEEKILSLSKAHVPQEHGIFTEGALTVKKNRAEETPGKYMIDLVLEDSQGQVVDVCKVEVTVRSYNKFLLFIGSILALLALLGGMWWFSSQPHVAVSSGLPDAVTEKISDNEMKKYANEKVNASNVTLHVYPEVTIKSDGITGTLFVQNLPVNKTGQTVTLQNAANGEVLFTSNLIKPGYQISQVKLNEKMDKGVYKGLVQVSFYDLEAQKQVGRTDVQVSIMVE